MRLLVRLNGAMTVSLVQQYILDSQQVFSKIPPSTHSLTVTLTVYANRSANLWMCPPINHGASAWWCGDSLQATPCQNISSGHFVSYTGGSVLGFPPLTAFASAQTPGATIAHGISPATATETPTSQPSAAGLAAPSSNHNGNTAIAIGVGVGVPLGVAAIGLLGFLFWRESRRRPTRGRTPGLNSQSVVYGDSSPRFLHEGEWRGELQDSQAVRELDQSVGRAS